RFFLVHGLGLVITLLPYGLWLAPGAAIGGGAAGVGVLLYVARDLCIYAASARGPASLVHPPVGPYTLPAPAYGGLGLGDRPGCLGWPGIALALGGIVLVLPARDNPFVSRSRS